MILLEQAQSWHCSPASEISACALEPALPELHCSNKHSEQELALERVVGNRAGAGRLSQAGWAPSRLNPVVDGAGGLGTSWT